MARIRIGLAPVALIIMLALGGCSVSGDKAYTFQTGEVSPADPAPALNLTDQNGNAFSLADQKGKVVLLYFGYTTCPDVCPATLSDWTEVKKHLGDDADQVEFVMVTVDPDRDTSAKLAQYLSFFDPTFIGLTGTQSEISNAESDFGVTAIRQDAPDSAAGYLMNHTTSYWAIDTDGNKRLLIAHGTDPEIIAEDVKHLLK